MSKSKSKGANKPQKPMSAAAQRADKAGKVISAIGVATSGAGKGIGMMPGAKPKAVGMAASAVGKVIKYTGDVVQKIANSNDANWYAYEGMLAKLATNELRPFNPEDLINSGAVNKQNAYALGVPHVITTNMKEYDDFFKSEAFNLVTNQMYADIRMTLRSNLAYTVDDLRDYLRSVISLAPVVAQVAKYFRMYDVTRPDMPELQTAFRVLPSSDKEYGLVRPTDIEFLSDEKYPNSINAAEKLIVILKQLPVPLAWAEYVNWLFGTVFTDQHAPNAQLYHNVLRVAYIYGANNTIVSSFDLANLTIEDIYRVAESIFTQYGTVIADVKKHLTKSSAYYKTLDAIFDFNGSQVISEDYEYFNYVINGYTTDDNGISALTLFGTGNAYARIDTLSQLSDKESAGATLAIAKGAGATVPFAITSQNAFYRVGMGTDIPNNLVLDWNPGPSNKSLNAHAYGTADARDCYYQFCSNMNVVNKIEIRSEASSINLSTTPTQKLAFNHTYTFTGFTLTTARRWNLTVKVPYGSTKNTAYSINDVNAIGYNDQEVFFMRVTLDDSLSEPQTLQLIARDLSSNTEKVIASQPLTSSFPGLSFTKSTEISAGRPVALVFQFAFSAQSGMSFSSVDGATATKIAELFTVGSNIYQTNPFAQLSLSATTTSDSWNIFATSSGNMARLVEDIDYHIPVRLTSGFTVIRYGAELNMAGITELPLLLKETYVPQIVSIENVRSVTYWMMVGLLSKF